MKVTLFGEEAIVHLKRVGKIKNTVVGPNGELDRKRGVEPRNREFKETPQKIIAVVRLHTDHVDDRGDLLIGFGEKAGQEFQEDASRDRVSGEAGARDAQGLVAHLDHDAIKRGDRNQIDHESLLEGIVPFHRGFHREGLKTRK